MVSTTMDWDSDYYSSRCKDIYGFYYYGFGDSDYYSSRCKDIFVFYYGFWRVTITCPDVKTYMVFECLNGLFVIFVGGDSDQ